MAHPSPKWESSNCRSNDCYQMRILRLNHAVRFARPIHHFLSVLVCAIFISGVRGHYYTRFRPGPLVRMALCVLTPLSPPRRAKLFRLAASLSRPAQACCLRTYDVITSVKRVAIGDFLYYVLFLNRHCGTT